MKLYRNIKDTRWFAFDPKLGWVMFPAEVGGWQKRQPSSGTDRIDMREVPLRLAFNTGIPGTPMSADGALDLPLTKLRPMQNRRKRE